jgi:hypothetical protein
MFDYWKSLLFSAFIFTCYVFSEGVDVSDPVMTSAIGPAALIAGGTALYNLAQSSRKTSGEKELEKAANKKAKGLSKAQRRGMLGNVVRGLLGSERGTKASLKRQAAAAGGFGRSGRIQEAFRDLETAKGETLAGASADIQKASQAKLDADEARRQAAVANLAAVQEGRKQRQTAAIQDAGATAYQIGRDIRSDRIEEAILNKMGYELDNPGKSKKLDNTGKRK